MTKDVYSNDAQLREEDSALFRKSDQSWIRKHKRAAEDIRRDLKRHGYFPEYDELDIFSTEHELVDDSAKATVELTFTATADGTLSVPKGTRVLTKDPSSTQENGLVAFVTDEVLSVSASNSGTVAATAESFGDVYNVEAGSLEHLEATLTNFDSVTNAAEASGGADHQMTRTAVYRVLELVYMDLMREEGDALDARRKLNAKAYREELERMMAGGIDIDTDGDNDADIEDHHGFTRFRRG
jgi:hypothetical protein